MSGRPELLRIVAQWLGKADEDLKVAESLLAIEQDCPFATVCFHAQQAAEKYLKAFLTFRGVPFPKTHDLAELVAVLPGSLVLPLTPAEIGLLKRYAVETRYPGDWDPIGREDSENALRMSKQIRNLVRSQLPAL